MPLLKKSHKGGTKMLKEKQTLKEKFKSVRGSYLFLKAAAEAADEELKQLESDYLKKCGLSESFIFCIEDEELFEYHSGRFSKLTQSEFSLLVDINQQLKKQEDHLILEALNLVPLPQKERQTLLNGYKKNYKIKKKLIELALKLDINTVA